MSPPLTDMVTPSSSPIFHMQDTAANRCLALQDEGAFIMRKVLIALAAVATVFAASTISASARPGGGMGGMRMGGGGMGGMRMGGGMGGMRMGGGMGMRSAGVVGINRGAIGINRGAIGINRGFVGAGINRGFVGVNRGFVGGARVVRTGNFIHRPFIRNRFFFAGGVGVGWGLGYGGCVRQVLTAVGWTWVNVCGYSDDYYY